MKKIAIAVAATLALPAFAADEKPASGERPAEKVQVSRTQGGVDKGAAKMAPKKGGVHLPAAAADREVKQVK